MGQKGYSLEHATMMINDTTTNITNINVACEGFNLTQTYFTYNITTDMIDDIVEEDTIDKCNVLTMKYEAGKSIVFLPAAFVSFLFLVACMEYFYTKGSSWVRKEKWRKYEAQKNNLRRRRAKRLQPPSYAELSHDYPSPPSWASLEDLQEDIELPKPEETPRDESRKIRKRKKNCILTSILMIMFWCLVIWVYSPNDISKEALQHEQTNTSCITFCYSFAERMVNCSKTASVLELQNN